MESAVRVESENGVPPSPKPPDGEGEELAPGQETAAQASPVMETDLTPKSVSVKSGADDLHGDWIAVTKQRRQQKSRDMGHAVNARDTTVRKGNSGPKLANKFDILKSNNVTYLARGSRSNGPPNSEKGPIFSATKIPPKTLSRKKRPRKEPVFGPIKIVQEESYKPFLDALAKHKQRQDSMCSDQEEEMRNTDDARDRRDKGADLVKKSTLSSVGTLLGGVKTTMNVEVVGSNRLRFIDEPKPPNDAADEGQLVSTDDMGESMDVLAPIGSNFTFQVLYACPQAITIMVKSGNEEWACSGIYARPTFSLRNQLWEHLRGIRDDINIPWTLIGDFNDVLFSSEQHGAEVLKDGFQMKIGNGESSFWYEDWTTKGLLCQKVVAVDIHDVNLCLKDLWINGEWDLSRFYTILPPELAAEICNTSFSNSDNIPDVIVWEPCITVNTVFTHHHTSLADSRMVGWQRPQAGAVALNVDGSALGNPGLAGFGGLLRDGSGNWLKGFYGGIGVSEILHAELLAIKHGLELAWSEGYRNVIVWSDSQLALDLIDKEVNPCYRYAGIISCIQSWTNKE
ncbi:Ribonuclease H domain [Sesbania bispinosa]|nr:Ribonuclease H domain [Sesbania bispinosa]